MAWGKGGSKTLDATATQFDITGLSSESTNLIVHSFPSGASAPRTFEVNGTSGTYDVGNCDGGGAIGHSPNYAGSLCDQGGSWGDDAFIVGYMMSIEGKEKIMIYDTVGSNSNGTAPRRRAWASRSNSNTGALTSVTVETSGGSGSIAGSNFSILGSDKTPTLGRPINIQDNSILVEKDIGNRYWRTPAVSYTDEDITWDSTTAVNVSISGNTATATGTSAWDKIIRSTQTWTPSDEPTLEFTIAIGGGVFNQMNGFGKGTLGSSYQTLDYALYTEATLAVYESGVSKFTDSSVTPSSSDTFKVTMDSNGLVKYWRNGSVFYTSLQTASGTYYAQFTPRTLGESTTMTYSSTTPATWTMEPTYETDFSTSKGWGMSGDKVRVDTTAGKCKFTLLASNGTDRIYQPLSRTLSDKFICEWDFLQTAISASHHYYMVSLTAGTGDPQTSTQNGIMARYTTNTANNRDISAGVKVGAGSYTNKVADDNKADYNNKIYFTMIRNVDNLRLIAYSDSTRTTVISDKNADFTETVTGLNTLILGAGSASSGGTLSAEIDNFKIYDGVISI